MFDHKILSIVLIFLGAIIMLMCAIKFHSTRIIAQSFQQDKTATKDIKWYKIHHLLMIFFLIGYILILLSIIKEFNIIGEIFISIIFFFGAAFVFLGIVLQNNLLDSIKTQYQKYAHKNAQLTQIQDANIFTLAYLAEIRDSETGKHIERTSLYVKEIALELSKLAKYKSHLTETYIEDIVKSAPLHDIGKVGVEDAILKKNGKLTPEEFELIKRHCEYGSDILKIAESKVDFQSYMTLAIPLVRSHHERWDGNGYPDGLRADQIPLSAQIMAVADVYDALRCERCYKKAFTHEKSKQILVEDRGTHFSPDVIDAYLRVEKKIYDISLRHID